MVVFPNCKINLGLNVIRKRTDGFHDLETVFYPLPWHDVLEVVKVNESAPNVQFSTSGITISGNRETNLCVQAYTLLKTSFPRLSPIRMHLHKTIPMGAGLGGGSANGAFTLELLNRQFHLGLSENKLMEYALALGSDCPFFIVNKPCFASGRGELFEEISLDLSPYKILLVNPGIHINTKEAFSMVNPASPSKSIREIIRQSIKTWKNELNNDFENAVFENYPEIKRVKQDLYGAGAVYASLSGSGSTVFGIFGKETEVSFSSTGSHLLKTIFC